MTGQTCLGTFIRSHKTTRQATHRIMLVTDVYTSNIISCKHERIHLDKCSPSFCFIRMTCHEATCHRISSPTQVRWLRHIWGLRPSLSFASTEAPDFSSSATTSTWPFSAAQCSGVPPRGGGHGARPGGGSAGPSFRAHCTRPGSSQK